MHYTYTHTDPKTNPFKKTLTSKKSDLKGRRECLFGFNGKEMDSEVSGKGNQYDYGFRIYNPRIGRFLSVDPLFKSYPWYTPYQFAGNMPIWAIDLDGLEEKIVTDDGVEIHANYVIPQDIVDKTDIDIVVLENILNTHLNHEPLDDDQTDPNNSQSETSEPQDIQFKVCVYIMTPDDVSADPSKSKIYTMRGQSKGGRVKMGKPNDPNFDVGAENESPAYRYGNSIILNPLYFDKTYENYRGTKGFVKKLTVEHTILHEVGHDLGLQHEAGEYPDQGLMGDDIDKMYPTESEIEKIIDPDNDRIIQPENNDDINNTEEDE